MAFALKKYPDAGPAPDMLSPVFMQDQPQPSPVLPQTVLPKVVQASNPHLAHTLQIADGMSGPITAAIPSTEPDVVQDPNPLNQIEGHLTNKLQRAFVKEDQPKGFFGKLGDTMANVINYHPVRDENESLVNQLENVKKQQSEQALQGAQTHEVQSRETAEALTPATADEGKAFGVPEGTMLNAASRAALAKQQGINQTKVSTTTETNQTKRDIADAATLSREKIAALKPEQRDDRAIRLMEKPPEQRTQEENAYLGAYSKWVDQTKTQPGVQRMMALSQFRPAQVVNPDGSVSYDYMGHAIKTGANTPQSMNFRTATRLQAFMTSGKGGQTLTAYRTANDHLGLLEDAMQALNNGDVQLLNKLNNRFKAEFGSSAPTNFDTIRAMLAGELGNVSKVTGVTDIELKNMRQELANAQSPEQIQGIIDTNHHLMDQKAIEMMKQYETGMQGKPEFGKGVSATPNANSQSAGVPAIGTVEDGHKFKGGNPADPKNWEKVVK